MYKRFLRFGIAIGLLLSNVVYAKMQSVEINGNVIEYSVPDISKIQLPENMDMGVKVLIADPTPLPENYRPIRAKSISTRDIDKATSTTFIIDYIASGELDRYGEPCYTFPEEAKANFQAAAAIWANSLDTDVPVTIQACWADMSGSSTLGYSGSIGTANFLNAPIADTYYKMSLANSFAGEDIHTDYYDMYITYNGAFSWYYGTDGNTPIDQYDLLSVVLHEMAHGLNFSGGMNYAEGVGSYGTYPYIWDRFIVDVEGNPLLYIEKDSIALGDALTSGNLYFNGPKAKAAYGGNKVKIYTPSTWAPGSSYSHLDYDTFNNTSDKLMVFSRRAGEVIHDPGDLTFGMLEDMGWKVSPSQKVVNMAPIITYLLSDTTSSTSISASDFRMELDVNISTVAGDWKVLSSASDTEAIASVKTQGVYGTFTVTGDTLSYEKMIETNAIDSGILEITNGADTKEITVTIESLYWKQLIAGDYHTAAIKSDGTLWAWGFNTYGQLGDDTNISKSVPTQEFTQATDWSSVSAGGYHTVAVKSDGTLWAWGSNSSGRLGDGTTDGKWVPTQEFTQATDWSSVSAGTYHTAAIKSDGTLWAWGSNTNGKLGDDTNISESVPTQEFTGSTNWVSVDAGRQHTAAIKSDGTLWAWGDNVYGQLGDDTTDDKWIPTQEFTQATDWSSVSAGGYHTAAIKSDGTLWAWGAGGNGRLGNGTTDSKWVPTQEFTQATDWSSVSAGRYHTAAIKSDGTLWSWGANSSGQLGDGTTNESWVPVQEFTGSTNWSFVSAGYYHTATIKPDGTLWSWGSNSSGQLGDGTTDDSFVPIQTEPREFLFLIVSNFTMVLDVNESSVIGDWKVLSSVNNTEATASIKTHGTYGVFELTGDSLSYEKTIETNATDSAVLEITDGIDTVEITVTLNSLYWKQVSAGYHHTVAIKSDGTLWSWGENNYGQLGDGTTDDSLVPIQELSKAADWISVSTGLLHTAAIRANGTLWAWGYNYTGQLGDGTTTNSSVPTQEFTGTSDWISVSPGGYHTAAIKSNGTLWAWGDNRYGQLGDGTNIDKWVPTQEFTESTNWSSVSTGDDHTVAIKNGTLWAWGDNLYGQLGDDTTEEKWVPTQEFTESPDWDTVSAGEYHTVAIKSDGTLWAWGFNWNGQLAYGANIDKLVPTQEYTGSTDWSSPNGGQYHTSTIKSNGTLWAWGDNSHGQLGDGTTQENWVPIQEYTGDSTWNTVSAGTQHTAAIRSDGTLWTWGSNEYGQLGDGTTGSKIIPIQLLKRPSSTLTASDFRINVDLNESTVNWKVFSYVSKIDATASVSVQGSYGVFEITGDSLYYMKTGANTTDSGVLEITDGTDTVVITVSVVSPYWKQVSTGPYHTAAIKSDGTLWAWGSNSDGQLGDGTDIGKSDPAQEFTRTTDWISVSVGNNHTTAIKSDGALWTWGSNSYGQLGDDTAEDKWVPTQEYTGSTAWITSSAGYDHTVAIKSDGTLWAWGRNSDGQLGDGTTDDKSVPTQEFTESTDWSSVSTGAKHTIAIKNGTLWAWGDNAYGKLGDGNDTFTTEDKWVPTQEFTGASDWISSSAGYDHTVAIKSDGTLWAWGSNSDGQLGDGTIEYKLLPTQELTGATTWSSVSTGAKHTIAIKTDGTLWGWGKNEDGQLGDGTTTDRYVPFQESTVAIDWSSVSAGDQHTYSIKLDGTLWKWGE